MKTIPLFLALWMCTAACRSSRVVELPVEPQRDSSVSVIPLRYAVAGEVADELTRLRLQTRAVPDARTNSVIVTYTTEADLIQLSDCIARLDVPVAVAK